MSKIPMQPGAVKLPVSALRHEIETFVEPLSRRLGDKRLGKVVALGVQGVLSGQSPVITEMARGVARDHRSVWPVSKRFYRFLYNPRCASRKLLHGVYRIARQTVEREDPSYVLVAIDPVNYEKPYTERLEGVSTVLKATPPGPKGHKRLVPGYPAITARIVNLSVPAVTYADWFSYTLAGVHDPNWQVYRSIRMTRWLLPERSLCFVADAGLDDQKVYRWVERTGSQFIVRACHNRLVEVYNGRCERWECELLDELTPSVPLPVTLRAHFNHARRVRTVDLKMGWLTLRFPDTKKPLWALLISDPDKQRRIVLLTNIPIRSAEDARRVYTDWSHRPKIEHVYRFEQEDGLDVEDVRVRTLERMRRLFALVLLAALFIYHLAGKWPKRALTWLRCLGGKLGLSIDRDGVYVLLAGVRAVFVAAATINYARNHPFPFQAQRCG